MTEAEWLTAPYDEDVLDFVRSQRKASPRKIRLFCCGLVRREVAWLRHPWAQETLALAERFADDEASRSEMKAAHLNALRQIAAGALPETTEVELRVSSAAKGATWAACPDPWAAAQTFVMLPEYRAGEALYFRDVVGNPFRKVKFAPKWRTETAVSLARQMYEAREFGAMPILADALQDAGCDSADVLDHCRDTSLAHVRGCWVVDLVLGKK